MFLDSDNILLAICGPFKQFSRLDYALSTKTNHHYYFRGVFTLVIREFKKQAVNDLSQLIAQTELQPNGSVLSLN